MKKLIIGVMLLIVISILAIYPKLDDEELSYTTDSNSNNLISMMLENDDGTYVKSTSNNWPLSGYVLNTNKSYCVNGSNLNLVDGALNVEAIGTDRCYAYFDKATLANTCVDKEIGSCFSQNANLDSTIYFHDENLTGGAQDNSYRYAGSSEEVKNYVCLDGGATSEGKCGETDADLYRIIGLFKNSEDLYEMKLIKYDYATPTQLGTTGAYNAAYSYDTSNYKGNKDNLASIGGYYWTSKTNQVNEWVNSKLRKTNLNDYYLNTYLKEEKGIDTDNLITTHTWSLNGYSTESVTPKVMYDNEMDKVEDSSPSYPTQTKEVSDKIGLMYVSDYGYAVSPSSTSNWSSTLSNYGSYTSNNWMYMGLYEWTISRRSGCSDDAFYVSSMGSVYNYNVYSSADGVRPSFYITSSAKLASGDGTKENPYRLYV